MKGYPALELSPEEGGRKPNRKIGTLVSSNTRMSVTDGASYRGFVRQRANEAGWYTRGSLVLAWIE